MEKYITFSVPIKKEVINNNGDKKTITYKLKFIDSFRFMSTSLSELVDNMSGNFNSIECKSCTENNRCKQCKKIIEVLIKKLPSIYQFCSGDLNKLLRNVVILMNIWIARKNLMKLHDDLKKLFIVI